MSKLEELIQQYCPDGVEYKTLGELGKFYGGLTGKTKEDFKDGNAHFITYMNVFKNPAIDITTDDKVRIGDNEKQNTIQYGDVIFTGSSESREEAGFTSVLTIEANEKLYLNSFCFGYRFNKPIFLPDFCKHLFRSTELRKQIMKTVSGVTRFNVSKAKMEKVQVPLPALPVQREIVRILDEFSLLSAELTAELTARKKQYEFFQDYLLWANRFEKVKLKELCQVNQGFQIPISQRKKEPGPNRYFYITIQFLKNSGDTFYIENPSESVICNKDDILVTRTGSTGEIIRGYEGCFHNNFFKVTSNSNIDKNYLYHVLKSNKMFNKLLRAASGGTVPDLPHNKFYNLEIELPPINKQKEIVKLLDAFDVYANNICEGLPAEIEARQKQYEYYRDKLLSFKRLDA